jgi:hypothetical protein
MLHITDQLIKGMAYAWKTVYSKNFIRAREGADRREEAVLFWWDFTRYYVVIILSSFLNIKYF